MRYRGLSGTAGSLQGRGGYITSCFLLQTSYSKGISNKIEYLTIHGMPVTVLCVPGFWEGPTVYGQVRAILEADGIRTSAVTLASTGHKSPDNPTMKDDIAAIREQVAKITDAGDEVILLLHSAAGFLGSNAIEGLEASKRKAEGKQGGVTQIVFLAAGVRPEGTEHATPPFMQENVSYDMLIHPKFRILMPCRRTAA